MYGRNVFFNHIFITSQEIDQTLSKIGVNKTIILTEKEKSRGN